MTADAKSILNVLTLAASKGVELDVEVEGADEGARCRPSRTYSPGVSEKFNPALDREFTLFFASSASSLAPLRETVCDNSRPKFYRRA